MNSKRLGLAVLNADYNMENAVNKKSALMQTVKELLEIEEELRQKPQADSRMMHITLLRNASDLLRENPEQEAALPIALAWINDFSLSLCSSNLPHQFKDDIDIFIEIVVRHSLTNEIAADLNAARIMAFACTTRVLCHTLHMPHPLPYNVGKLLNQWANKTVGLKTSRNLAAHVDLLYGPGVWDLYGSDLKKMEHLPGHLYMSGVLPKLSSNTTPQQARTNDELLPNTLI